MLSPRLACSAWMMPTMALRTSATCTGSINQAIELVGRPGRGGGRVARHGRRNGRNAGPHGTSRGRRCRSALDRHRVAFEPAHRRAGVEVCFSERRLQPGITMDMSSNETIKHAVMAGMGLSFLSLHTVGPVHCGLIAYFGPT